MLLTGAVRGMCLSHSIEFLANIMKISLPYF